MNRKEFPLIPGVGLCDNGGERHTPTKEVLAMKPRIWRWACGAPVLFLITCRAVPGFARAALEGVSVPVMGRLHRLSAPVPFPVAEAVALGIGGATLASLAAALVRGLVRRELGPMKRWLAGLAGTAIALGSLLALLWGPALAMPVPSVAEPDDGRLVRLCDALIERLNASELCFPEASEVLRRAPEVAGSGCRGVKAARYPEWMRAARVCGLFVPLTGEALIDVSAPAALIPFTAVHELTHLSGVADEGAANIAAWRRCVDAGGAFADSARLWALRYAMGILRQRDADAWRRMAAKMKDPLRRVYLECGAEAGGAEGMGFCPGDYADLARALAGRKRD